MILDKPTALVFLKPNGLDIFTQSGEYSTSLEFTPEELRHLEVINAEKIAARIAKCISSLKSQQVLLALSDEVVFEKRLPSQEANQAALDDFFANVPFDKQKIIQKVVSLEDEKVAISCNRQLCEIIVNTFHEKGWLIKHILPLSVFKTSDPGTPMAQEVPDILRTINNHSAYDLVSGIHVKPGAAVEANPQAEDENADDAPRPTVTIQYNIWLLAILGIVILIMFGVLGYQFYQARSTSKEAVVPSIEPSVIPAASSSVEVSATPAAEFKSTKDLTVTVLNGSGISGQAGKVKTELEKLGLTHIDVGNSVTAENSKTTIASFSASVSDKDQQGILDVLDTFFTSVDSTISAKAQYDVYILTGSGVK